MIKATDLKNIKFSLMAGPVNFDSHHKRYKFILSTLICVGSHYSGYKQGSNFNAGIASTLPIGFKRLITL